MIKQLTAENLIKILEISVEQFKEESWSKQQYLSSLAEPNTLIFYNIKNNVACGFLVVQVVLDEINILLIATKESYKKQNVASELLEYLISFAEKNNIKKIWLEVKEDNTPAQKLYFKFNFNLINIRKNYYKNNKNALILEKIIKN